MPIVIRLDVMLAKRKVRSNELAEAIGITQSNLSLLKSGHVRGIRFSTLEAICEVLDCQPGELLEYVPEEEPVNSKKGTRSASGASFANPRTRLS
jgi:putative transcriptional regulator